MAFGTHFAMNNFTRETSPVPQPAYAVAFGSIMSVGFPLNAIAIWILLRHHSLKSPNVIFMLNLAISDLLLASSLPIRVYFYATGTWPLGHTACIGANVFFMYNIHSSSTFITFISIDRLLAVVYPLRSRHIRTARNATKAAVLVWVFVSIIAIPVCIAFKNELEHHKEYFCFEHPDKGSVIVSRFARGVVKIILVLFLLIVNVVSTVLVLLTLRRNVKDLPKVNNNTNVMLIFAMSLIMFTVCFLPLAVELLLQEKHTYLHCIAAANCCLDPVLYYFSLDAFWKKKEERNQLRLRDVVQETTEESSHR